MFIAILDFSTTADDRDRALAGPLCQTRPGQGRTPAAAPDRHRLRGAGAARLASARAGSAAAGTLHLGRRRRQQGPRGTQGKPGRGVVPLGRVPTHP